MSWRRIRRGAGWYCLLPSRREAVGAAAEVDEATMPAQNTTLRWGEAEPAMIGFNEHTKILSFSNLTNFSVDQSIKSIINAE